MQFESSEVGKDEKEGFRLKEFTGFINHLVILRIGCLIMTSVGWTLNYPIGNRMQGFAEFAVLFRTDELLKLYLTFITECFLDVTLSCRVQIDWVYPRIEFIFLYRRLRFIKKLTFYRTTYKNTHVHIQRLAHSPDWFDVSGRAFEWFTVKPATD